jgi:phytanoyl-CoA hydroxylase
VGSGVAKELRPHRPAHGDGRDDGHAITTDILPNDEVRLAPARRGSVTLHDEYIVHGSGGNTCKDKQRRTYVVAYRAKEIVDAERKIGFTHSHNDEVNWDTFDDGEEFRNKKK